jgi:hypothetical protein
MKKALIVLYDKLHSKLSRKTPAPSSIQKATSGINEEELDGVLVRVFARHRIPLELRLAIWKLVDLGECLGCSLLYPNAILHLCTIEHAGFRNYAYGPSSLHCPRCVPSHFCITLNETYTCSGGEYIDKDLKAALYIAPDHMCIHFDKSNKYYALTGFNKMHVDMIHQSLKDMSDGIGHIGARIAVFSPFELRGMKIEYVEGVFE